MGGVLVGVQWGRRHWRLRGACTTRQCMHAGKGALPAAPATSGGPTATLWHDSCMVKGVGGAAACMHVVACCSCLLGCQGGFKPFRPVWAGPGVGIVGIADLQEARGMWRC